MQPEESGLSSSVILAAARELLSSNGFRVSSDLDFATSQANRTLLAEDDYSVIALVAYDTWSELQAEWTDAQAELVALLAKRLSRSEPKAWDGYLVLMCASSPPDPIAVSAIERDTTRVRKIVATADTLLTTKDIAHILDPFVPLGRPGSGVDLRDVLATLPELLKKEVPIAAMEAVVDAFRTMEPPLDRLHALGEDL